MPPVHLNVNPHLPPLLDILQVLCYSIFNAIYIINKLSNVNTVIDDLLVLRQLL